MKEIDINNWERKKQYKFFRSLDYPHVNLCANINITNFYKTIKEKEIPFFIAFVYVATRAVNDIDAFRQRIRGEKVVEHDIINPSFTIMSDEGVFTFCKVEFKTNLKSFVKCGLEEIEERKRSVDLKDEPNRDDVIFMTSIPWVSFTSMMHPIHMSPVDSVPRIAWGKYFKENEKLMMPLSVQAHHSLVDGMHIGQYFERIQHILDNIDKYL